MDTKRQDSVIDWLTWVTPYKENGGEKEEISEWKVAFLKAQWRMLWLKMCHSGFVN